MLLAIDTSTAAVTVAVHDGANAVAHFTEVDARRHTELLAPAIAGVLAEAGASPDDLTGVAVGVGPGPFTGLRIGLVTARTLGLALAIPVHGVCSLDIIAADARVDGRFVVVTDARRREVYRAEYERPDGDVTAPPRRLDGPAVVPPDEVATTLPAAGAGARMFPDLFPNAVDPELPDAATLAAMVAGGSADILPPVPLYLRRPDARPPGARKSVLSR